MSRMDGSSKYIALEVARDYILLLVLRFDVFVPIKIFRSSTIWLLRGLSVFIVSQKRDRRCT